MFNDDEEEFLERNLSEHISKFESYLKGESFFFFDSDVLEMIVDHYIVNGDYTKAIKAAEYGLNYFSPNQLFVLRIAQAYSAKGLLKEALNMLANKDDFRENLVEYYLTKASIFSQLKNSDNAIKFFKLALDLTESEERDEIFLDIAMEYQYKGDFKAAIDILNEAIKANPKNEVALYEVAYCYDFIGEFDKAIACYTVFIDENPYSYTAWYNLGNIYSKVEDWNNALNAYDFCVVINENFSPVYFNMGNAYLSLDRYALGEEAFQKCIELEGEDALAYCYLGECLEQQGKLEKARESYLHAVSLNPELSDAWLGLGIVSDLEGNTEKGIELIQKAIDIEPANASYYHVLASAYDKIDRFEEAELFFLKSLELDPKNDEAVKDYYVYLFTTSQWQKATNLLDDYQHYNENYFTISLLRFHWYWNNLNQDLALEILASCIVDDREKAKQIFDWFDDFADKTNILNLFEN